MKNIVEIRDLLFSYPASDKFILDGVNLQIKKGDFLAVLGNNGSGKSTLCKAINGLIPHFISGNYQGQVLINGKSTLEMNVGTLAKDVAYVYQDFENQIVKPLVLDDASYACLNYGYRDYEKMGLDALKACGLYDKKDSFVWELSGGQTHLLALASAIALGPDILILDEPIAQLDPKNALAVYEILKDLNENFGKTIITIEHHTDYIARFCSHAMLIKDGKIQWKLPTNQALNKVEELEDSYIYPPQVTQAAYRSLKNAKNRPNQDLPINIEEGAQFFKDFTYHKRPQMSAKAQGQKEPIIKFDSVGVSYDQISGAGNVVFEDLDLEIYKGQKVALVGSNGAGKSTLMKLIIGLVSASSGRLEIFGQDARDISPEFLSNGVSLVYQNPEEMFIMDSISEDISYAMKERSVDDYETKTELLLERFRLEDLKDRDGRLLSGGQMRRASLAIGVALGPEILMLDEPTANLDMATKREITRVLEDIKDTTETVIIASHDMQLVADWAQRIIVLDGGKILADGTRDEIFSSPIVTDQLKIQPPEIFRLAKTLDESANIYSVEEFIGSFSYDK